MAQRARKLSSHDEQVRQFLQPEVVSKLHNMELRARLVVEGFIQGLHRSPYHGFSVEFAEYRQYIPGDEPRFIDWKLFGKTDRYYVKVFEEETNLKGMILLDKSASMGFAGKGFTDSDNPRFDTEENIRSVGAGFRYLLARKLKMHVGIDVAQGPEETSFYLVMGSSWAY